MKPLTARLLTILFVLFLLAPAAEARKSSIRRIDFHNFTYPGVWNKKPITLTNGKLEIVGEPCPHFNYTLEDVDYIDLDGDGDEEALVHVQDFTGCVSSSVHQNFYIYRMRKGRAHLMWKFATGAEGEAGLKDLV